MPVIGEIRKGREIGGSLNSSENVMWSACQDCGNERWVKCRKGRIAHPRCRSCATKARVKPPMIYNDPPKIGEIRRKKTSYVVWLPCVDCGSERWTTYTPQQPGRLRCCHCANVARRTHRELITTEPQPNEIRHGYEIGKNTMSQYIWVACVECGKFRWQRKINGKPESARCRGCYPKYVSGKLSVNWKGGETRTPDGYIMISLYPDDPFYLLGGKPKKSGARAVPEHRLVMARHLGRILYLWEVVHHKNGVRDDNRIENLELSTNKTHIVMHNKGYKDGYIKGLADGSSEQVKLLKLEIIKLGNIIDREEERHRQRISTSVKR